MTQPCRFVAIDGPPLRLADDEVLEDCTIVLQVPTFGRVLFTDNAAVVFDEYSGKNTTIRNCLFISSDSESP